MSKKFIAIKNEVKSFIQFLSTKYIHQLYPHADKIIFLTKNKLYEVQNKYETIIEPTINEEIYFCKRIKARLLAIIYLCQFIKQLEYNKPFTKLSKVKKYYLKELFRTKIKIKGLDYFSSYFKSHSIELDEYFFQKYNDSHDLSIDQQAVELKNFLKMNTPFISIFAQVEALHLFKDYIKNKIKDFDKNSNQSQAHTISWTASKSSLIELIYALHAAGTFNNGQAEIKEIAEAFEKHFNIELGQYNRVFFDIRSRKINKTKFLDTLKENLENRIKNCQNELFY